MSGVEPLAVLGVISSIITIIETSQKFYEALANTKGLHEAFQRIEETIPLVLRILRKVEETQQAAANEYLQTKNLQRMRAIEAASKELAPIMLSCEKGAHELKSIFEKSLPHDATSRVQRYSKAIQVVLPGRRRKVEQRLKEILEKLQLLTNHQVFENAVISAEFRSAMEKFSITTLPLPREGAANAASRSRDLPGDAALDGEAISAHGGAEGNIPVKVQEEAPSACGMHSVTFNNGSSTKVMNQGTQVLYGGQSITL